MSPIRLTIGRPCGHTALSSHADHSFSSETIPSRVRLSPNFVEPRQASAFAKFSPPAIASIAPRKAPSGSVTVSAALVRRTASPPNGSSSNPSAPSSERRGHLLSSRPTR